MRRLLIGLMLAAAGFAAGCSASTYTKSVTVTQDGEGNVIGVVITETVSQPTPAQPLNLEYIRILRYGEREQPPETTILVPISSPE